MSFGVDFFLLGSTKAGTTSLNAYLDSHPQLSTSRPKESRFFDLYYARGLPHLEQCFGHATPEQLKGDCSPQNLCCAFVAERLAETFPKARLMAILRNPTERAYSHWWMKVSQGVEKRSFEDCVDHCLRQYSQHHLQQIESPSGAELWKQYCSGQDTRETPYLPYLENGLYHQHLERYLGYFHRDQLLVLSSHELKTETAATLRSVARFLGVKEEGFATSVPQINRSKGPFSTALDKVAKKTRIDRLVPIAWKCALRDKLTSLGDKPPTINPDVKAKVQEFYELESQNLERLLGRTFW